MSDFAKIVSYKSPESSHVDLISDTEPSLLNVRAVPDAVVVIDIVIPIDPSSSAKSSNVL